MVRKTYSLVLPCLNTKFIKTESIKTIESMLRDGLGTITEEPELTPTPTPRPPPTPGSGRSLQRKVSLQKRTVSVKLSKRPEGGWQMKISKFSTVISAPLTTIGDSYVRLMNGFMDKGNLGELAMFNGGDFPLAAAVDTSDSLPRSLSKR